MDNRAYNIQILSFISAAALFFASAWLPSPYSLILLAIFSAVALAYFFKDKPEYLPILLLSATAMGDIYSISLADVELRISDWAMLAWGLNFLFRLLSHRVSRIRLDYIAWLLLAYIALGLLPIHPIMNRSGWFYEFRVLLFSFSAYFLARQSWRPGEAKLLWLGLSLALLIVSWQVLSLFLDSGLTRQFFDDRSSLRLPIGAIALAGAILAFLLPPIISRALKLQGNISDIWYGAMSLIGLSALFLTLSKAAALALLVAIIYLFVKLKNRRLIIALLAFGLLSGAVLTSPSSLEGLVYRISHTLSDRNTEYRLEEYGLSADLFSEHPFLGIGWGNQSWRFQDYYGSDFNHLLNNYLIQSAVDLGLLGLFLVALLTLFIFALARRFGRSYLSYGLVAALIATAVVSQLEVTMFALNYALIFWSTLGAAANLSDSYEA